MNLHQIFDFIANTDLSLLIAVIWLYLTNFLHEIAPIFLIGAIAIFAIYISFSIYAIFKNESKNSNEKYETPKNNSLINNFNYLIKSSKRQFHDEGEKFKQLKFKELHNFVEIDVHSDFMIKFIEECEWLKKRVGKYPNKEEQNLILYEIYKS